VFFIFRVRSSIFGSVYVLHDDISLVVRAADAAGVFVTPPPAAKRMRTAADVVPA
jgi:hypothetical protein